MTNQRFICPSYLQNVTMTPYNVTFGLTMDTAEELHTQNLWEDIVKLPVDIVVILKALFKSLSESSFVAFDLQLIIRANFNRTTTYNLLTQHLASQLLFNGLRINTLCNLLLTRFMAFSLCELNRTTQLFPLSLPFSPWIRFSNFLLDTLAHPGFNPLQTVSGVSYFLHPLVLRP